MRQLVPALAVAGICILSAGCSSGGSNQGNVKSTTTTTTKFVPPVAEGAIDGLLLSPAQVNAAMGRPK